MTCFDRRARQRRGDGMREILEHDDRARAAVGKLVLELRDRVHRVDVHGDHARTQDAEQHDGRLQRIRHHDRHAIAGFVRRVALAGTPRRRGSRRSTSANVIVVPRFVNAGCAANRAKLASSNADERRIAIGIDLGRDARRVRARARA